MQYVASTVVRLAIVVVAIAALVLPLPAALVERWYSRGLYPPLQRVMTSLSNPVPVALLDLAAALGVFALVWQARRVVKSPRPLSALAGLGARIAVTGAGVYLAFLALWGLNYRRIPLADKLRFDEAAITRAHARQVAGEAVRLVNANHDEGRSSGGADSALETAFAEAQRLLGGAGTTVPSLPKRSLLTFYFRWAAIDGMVDPFFLETILSRDLLPVERPFVLAHEWAHLAGYADESEANFVAWLTCTRGDAGARYSGWLALYANLANALPLDDRRALAAMLGPGPKRDLLAIAARLQRSAPVVRRAAREVYDSYLKANRVERGIESYSAVVRLVLGVQFAEGWTPQVVR